MTLLCEKHLCAVDRESCTPLKIEHFVLPPPPVLMSDRRSRQVIPLAAFFVRDGTGRGGDKG